MPGPMTLLRTAPRWTQVSDVNVLDEFTHECLAIPVAHKLRAIDVAENLL
jgi:hypothetical protein